MSDQIEEWLWKFPDLPDLPDELEKMIYDSVNKEVIEYVDFNATLQAPFIKNGELKKSVAFFQYETEKEMKKWVYDNVAKTGIANVKSSKTYFNPDDPRDWRGPHTDTTRNYVLIWLLESGGPDHATVFYKEKNKPIIRENCVTALETDKLEELGRIQIPLKKWIILNSRILHSVINIPEPRIALQVGFVSVKDIKEFKNE